MPPDEIARAIDAAILRPELTRAEAEAAMRAAIAHGVRTICVRPCDTALAAGLCRGTSTRVCVVVGFPHGSTLGEAKAAEAAAVVKLGAAEIDMVGNYGWIRSRLWDEVRDDIRLVVEACRPSGVPVKVILETAQLEPSLVAPATQAAIDAGAAFVKTSTGFNGPGADEATVRTMLEAAGGRIRVKPSGGIRDRATAERFLAMGVHRLGINAASVPAILAGTPPAQAAPGAY